MKPMTKKDVAWEKWFEQFQRVAVLRNEVWEAEEKERLLYHQYKSLQFRDERE